MPRPIISPLVSQALARELLKRATTGTPRKGLAPLIFRSNKTARVLKWLADRATAKGDLEASGEGFSFPFPLGLGGVILLGEDVDKAVLPHELEHIAAGWDIVKQEGIDMRDSAVFRPAIREAMPYVPINYETASETQSDDPRTREIANYILQEWRPLPKRQNKK